MTACTHYTFCGKRMVLGDRANGCSSVDQATCSPEMAIRAPTPTAPPGAKELRPIWLRVRDLDKPR